MPSDSALAQFLPDDGEIMSDCVNANHPQDEFIPIWILQQRLHCKSYTYKRLGNSRGGNPKLEITFTTHQGNKLSPIKAVELTSKQGKPYIMCIYAF